MLITGVEAEEIVAHQADNQTLSQRSFSHTPFETTQWEFVGGPMSSKEFASIEIEVIHSEMTQADPMFRDFGSPVDRQSGVYSLAGNGGKAAEEPVIDEAFLEKVRAEAFEKGLEAGRVEGQELAAADSKIAQEELTKKMIEFQTQLLRELQVRAARTEKCAFDLALAISKKILVTTAEIRPEYILDVVRAALQSTGAGKPLRIRVSTQDIEFLEVIGVPAEFSTEETGISYVADEAISSGCVVETDFGEIDLRLEQMWQQVKENLYEVVK